MIEPTAISCLTRRMKRRILDVTSIVSLVKPSKKLCDETGPKFKCALEKFRIKQAQADLFKMLKTERIHVFARRIIHRKEQRESECGVAVS
ncbi:hypothetical protein Clacol_010617 [Clathrus columnatus]|uniref:Uncharacterized protein n=1 Tax=Clathrus columnatus TaxID=1419009 RepID=A0AAV5ANY9_9AGAM|nr:hypothetical protein Clacol_010617 [Clathrus columnatus]